MSSATHSLGPSAGPDERSVAGWRPRIATGVLVLANGEVIEGFGVGATGSAVGEVCFNTAMTGYEEILTDPSYAAQIVTFTFPHIGIVGVNDEDIEVVNAAAASAAVGAIFRADRSAPKPHAGPASTAWTSCPRSGRPSATTGTRRAGPWRAATAGGSRRAFMW